MVGAEWTAAEFGFSDHEEHRLLGDRAERVVCLDEGFAGNDQLKANAVQIFKTKGVTSFKTV